MTRREPGHGTIEELPSGRFRWKVWLADGIRHNATADTHEEAEGMIAALVLESQSASAQELTVRHLVRRYEEHLELSRSYAAMPNVRSLRKRWIETSEIADEPARAVDSGMVGAWVKTLGAVGERYARQALTLMRRAYAWGVGEGLVDSNPARDVQVARRPVAVREPWTYLEPAEQAAFFTCSIIPDEWRFAIVFAAGTGLRAGEQWALRLEDLVVDGPEPYVDVRYGSRHRAPKGRKLRRVPLFGIALDAAREQVTKLRASGVKNPHGLVFPSIEGGFRKVSRCPDWNSWLRAAGITRRVRWHDLRHTCGASLVSGWWGRRWILEEVRDLLGHHSVRMTERYAHLGASAVRKAALSTPGPRGVHGVTQVHGIAQERNLPRHPPQDPINAVEIAPRGPWAQSTARALLEAAERGEDCWALVAELAAATSRLAAELHGPHALDRALDLAGLIVAFGEAERRKGVAGA